MKIYSGYPGGITKITNGKDFYQTEDLSNVITVYVDKTNLTGITYTLTLEFLRADNRKTTLIPQAFEVGDDTTLTEDGVTYDIHNFVLTDSQLAVAGALAFTCYITIFNNSNVIVSRGALFNAVSNVRKTVTYSANTIFVVSEDEDDVPIIVADMKNAIETLSGQLASKVNKADVADNLTTNDSDKVLSAKQGYVLKAMLDALETATYTKTEVDSALALKADKDTTYTKSEVYNKTEIDGALALKADKIDTYTKTETDGKLALKADKIDTYTRNVINNFIADLEIRKADKSNTYTKSEIDTTINGIGETFGLIEGAIGKLESVQNVVDVVATKSALNSYDTSKLEENDKIQVIADESQGGASTIYNWSGSAWQYVGAYGTNSYTKPETLEQIDLHKLVNKTYSELATLRANNELVAGQMYRITDYVTTTNGICNGHNDDVRSMEHPFDIIVRAISNNKFSEEARAILHSGDSYFANSDLKAWRLWYCFENDSVRFEWADTSNGKGVIYRMIDEFENDVPYDFKNIQFKRYKITGTSDPRQANAVGSYYGFNGNYSCSSDSTDFIWCYTFSKRSDGSDLSLTQTLGGSWQNCYYVKQMIIREYLTDNPNYRGSQALNNIVFECTNIMVDVQMGAGSHHASVIGYKDLTYIYFKEMFRYNILYGEMSHTRADECFEQNMIGDFTDLSTDCTHWTRFAHHFGSNTAIHLTANDIKARVTNTKFPTTFFRCTISNIWDGVHARAHNTFSYCEFGYMSNVTLSGAGDWNGVRTIMNDHTTIKIAYLYGSTLGRMEFVSISEGAGNTYAIMNLTIGSIYGSSNKVLTIALSDLYSYELATSNEKKIDFAIDVPNDTRALYYTSKTITSSNILDGYNIKGTIQNDGSVVWSELDNLSAKFAEAKTYTDTKFNQAKSYTDNVINDLRWELGSHTLDVESDTDVAFSKSVPSGAIGCQLNVVGGMSYKSENLYNHTAETTYGGITYTISSDGTVTINGTSTTTIMIITQANLPAGTYTWALFNSSTCYNSSLSPLDDNLRMELRDGGVIVSSQVYFDSTNKTKTFTTTSTATSIYIRIGSGVTITNFTFKPMLVIGTTVPTTYEPYFEGIRNSAVTSVVSKDSNDTTIDTLAIPTAIQNLTGYGWGINNTCYNYIDFERKVFVQKVGKITVTENNFSAIGQTGGHGYNRAVFITPQLDMKTYPLASLSSLGAVITATDGDYWANNNTLTYKWQYPRITYINENMTSEANAKAICPFDVYYELATPIETDISAYLTTDTIDVEPNGTLEFTNTYSQDVPSDIDYLIEEVKA